MAEFEALLESDPIQARCLARKIVELESVVRLSDLLLRRTDWGIDPRKGREIGSKVSALLEWEEPESVD